jgi:hypothetical protein
MVPGMGTQDGPASPEKAPHDAAHLDEDAECLEDPVHCGDARHQHAVRAPAPATAPRTPPPSDESGQPA